MKIRALLTSLFAFVLILGAMNGYQYYRLKGDYTAGLVREIGAAEVVELEKFFKEVKETVLLVAELVRTEQPVIGGAEELTRKMAPFLERREFISGLILANHRGEEYFLYRKNGSPVARLSTVEDGVAEQVFIAWDENLDEAKRWQETRQYDPRQRPWFLTKAHGETVQWTPIYQFFQSGKKGITASVSWSREGEAEAVQVVGLDLSLDRLERILALREGQRPGFLFLTGADTALIASGYGGQDLQRQRQAVAMELGKIWQKEQQETSHGLKLTVDGQAWFGFLEQIETVDARFEVGYAVRQQELDSWLGKALTGIDWLDALIALSGAVAILLVLWKLGLIDGKNTKTAPPETRLFQYIDGGEGKGVEFKSTVRVNLKSNKVGKEIELAWLKAVVAFLNTSGGVLILGVDDAGRLLGLENDDFDNEDHCLLHIKNLFNQHLGADLTPYYTATLVSVDGRYVVMLECLPSREPVFLRIGKNEEFYIRSGPSSIKLSPSQIVQYVTKTKKL